VHVLHPITEISVGCWQSTEYRDRAVHAGKQYEYRVTAVGAGGVSDFSETSGSIKARPLKGAFAVLRDLRISNFALFDN